MRVIYIPASRPQISAFGLWVTFFSSEALSFCLPFIVLGFIPCLTRKIPCRSLKLSKNSAVTVRFEYNNNDKSASLQTFVVSEVFPNVLYFGLDYTLVR